MVRQSSDIETLSLIAINLSKVGISAIVALQTKHCTKYDPQAQKNSVSYEYLHRAGARSSQRLQLRVAGVYLKWVRIQGRCEPRGIRSLIRIQSALRSDQRYLIEQPHRQIYDPRHFTGTFHPDDDAQTGVPHQVFCLLV